MGTLAYVQVIYGIPKRLPAGRYKYRNSRRKVMDEFLAANPDHVFLDSLFGDGDDVDLTREDAFGYLFNVGFVPRRVFHMAHGETLCVAGDKVVYCYFTGIPGYSAQDIEERLGDHLVECEVGMKMFNLETIWAKGNLPPGINRDALKYLARRLIKQYAGPAN